MYCPLPIEVIGGDAQHWTDFDAGALSKYVFNPSVGVDLSPIETPPSIIHFSCHCNTQDSNPSKHTIDVGAKIRLLDEVVEVAHSVLSLGSLMSEPHRS